MQEEKKSEEKNPCLKVCSVLMLMQWAQEKETSHFVECMFVLIYEVLERYIYRHNLHMHTVNDVQTGITITLSAVVFCYCSSTSLLNVIMNELGRRCMRIWRAIALHSVERHEYIYRGRIGCVLATRHVRCECVSSKWSSACDTQIYIGA